MIRTLLLSALLLSALFLSALLLPVVPHAMAAASDIAEFRERFRSVTPTTFDTGGAVARQFHLEAPAWLEMMTIARTRDARALPVAIRPDVAALEIRHGEERSALGSYVETNPFVDGVIVLHEGRVVFEAYPRMAPWQRHFSWSVSKVVTSTLLGALVAQGRIDMDRNVTAYLPMLVDTAWDGIALRDIANMASGIDCRDADGYQTPTTCIYRLEEALGVTAPTGYDGGLEAHLRAMTRRGPAGKRNEYLSANTILLGLVIEAVTGKPFARAAQDLLWTPMGAEADGFVSISPEGFAYTSGGVTLRLRDLARFGELLVRPEQFGVLTPAIVADMQGPRGIPLTAERLADLTDAFPDDLPLRAGWQWDLVWADGGMFKGGYSGQGLYVDPARDLVVAWFGSGDDYGSTTHALRDIARQLAHSGQFAVREEVR